MDCGSRGSFESDCENVFDSRSESLLEDGGGGFLSKSQGELDGCISENNTSLRQRDEQKEGEDEFLMDRVEGACEIFPSLTSIMQPESIPFHLDEDKAINDMGICNSQAKVVDNAVKKYKYGEDVSSTKETSISSEVSTFLSFEVISDLRDATIESVACLKMVGNPGPVVPGCGLPSETTTLTSLPCSSLQENKVNNMKSINDEACIIESNACNQVSSTSVGLPLQSLCTGGSASTNCENCKDEQSLRVLESSRSMDENTGGDMHIQLPTAGDCLGTLDKLDLSVLNRVGLCGAQTDDALVHNMSTFSTSCRLEDTCLALGIVRNGSSQSLDVQEQSEKNTFGPISCSSAVGCTGQSGDAGNEIGGADCIQENDCLASLSSSLQKRYTTRKSIRKARGTVSRKKAVKKACMHETGGFLFKASRRKRSCPSKPARSSTWGLAGNVMPSAQQIKPGETGVQNQAVGPLECGRLIKESANKSQRGSSKKGQVSSGSLRFKIKVGKDVGQKILNTVSIEKVDASASADILSSNHITGMKGIASKFPKSVNETKKDFHKQRSDRQSKHKKDYIKEDSCPVACFVDPEFGNKDVSTDLQEKSADDAVSSVPGIQLVVVEACGGATDSRYMGPETSPDSEVIDLVPDVLSRNQELQSAVLTASDSLGCVKSSKNRNSTKKDNGKSDGAFSSRKSKSSKKRGGKKKSNEGFQSNGILHPSSIPDFSGCAEGKIHVNLLSENAFTEGILHPYEKDKIVVADEDVQLQYREDGNESCSPNCLRSLDSKMSRPSKKKQHQLARSSRPHSVNKGRSESSDSAFIGEVLACREKGLPQMQENSLIAHGDHQVEDVMNKNTGSNIASVDMPVLDAGLDGTSEQCTLPDSAWVLCDDCHKWRRIAVALANSMDEACSWSCKDNSDAAFSDCSVPQEKSDEDINTELGISDLDEERHNGELNYEVQEKKFGYRCRKAPQSHFWHIDSNEFLQRRRKSQTIDEIMVCHCKPPLEGQLGCGDSCLNRMLNIECVQDTCPCGDCCSNQQFQKRSYGKMEWARCGKKGFGLKMLEDITAGKFLIEYVGEVLDIQAYEARQNEYASKGQRHFYFMTLNANEIIDACVKGNLGRFINHSCDPNCRTEKWMVNGEICIGLFALRDIKKGEELTFDYNYVRVFGAAAKKCHCGSSQCRGYIGGDPLSTEVIVQDDSDEEYPEPLMLEDGQDLDSLTTMTSSRLDSVNDTKMPSFERLIKVAEENEISDVVRQTESPKESESSVGSEDLRTDSQFLRETAAARLEDTRIEFQVASQVDTAKEEKAINKLANSLGKPETSSSINNLSSQEDDADKKVKLEIKARRHAIPKSRPHMKTSSSVRAKKGKVFGVPPNVNKIRIVATKPQPFSTKSKKSLETSSCGRFETVEEKLNELLDSDGGITKRKDATKIYLKLLLLTAASGDSGNGEAIQRNRELSMILDALLKTKSRAVLTDIINKNGLQMLHNIMKKYRGDFIKIPILRKLLKVLEYLAMREILTLGHIMASPPCRGMESFRESILSLTEHGDKQVHQIARSFRDRWIPRQYKKSNYIERDEGRSDFSRTVDPNRFEHGTRPAGAVDGPKQVRSTPSTPSPNPANGESCSTSSGGVSGTTATRTRKRKSRWDVPGEPDNELKFESGAAKKLESSPLPELVASAHSVTREADESLNSALDTPQPLEAINREHGKHSNDDEDIPPGFSPLAISSISGAYQPSDLVIAYPQKRFSSRLPVSFGIPLETVQQSGSHAAESTGWVVAPSMPFHPFPPLPPHPRNRKGAKDTGSAPDRNDQAADVVPNSHTPVSSCIKETSPNLEASDHDTLLGKRTRQDSHALPRKYFRQQKRKGPPWPKDESIGKNRVGVGSADERVLNDCFPNDSNCRVGKAQNGFHEHPPYRSHD